MYLEFQINFGSDWYQGKQWPLISLSPWDFSKEGPQLVFLYRNMKNNPSDPFLSGALALAKSRGSDQKLWTKTSYNEIKCCRKKREH